MNSVPRVFIVGSILTARPLIFETTICCCQDRASFDPRQGDKVEVSFSEEDQVESWWEGDIYQIKGDFFIVGFSDQQDPSAREIVERERLRPAYGHRQERFEKTEFPLKPAELQVGTLYRIRVRLACPHAPRPI